MKYYKFKRNNETWILPVYPDSFVAKSPKDCFYWDKEIKFICEVTEKEYNEQFEIKKEPMQLLFEF